MDDRYDRQVRLWSATGQQALGAGHVAIVGASNAVLEAAKGLVLAGIGALTVVQGRHTQPSTLFSADQGALKQQLSDLNSDVNIQLAQTLADVRKPVSLAISDAASGYTIAEIERGWGTAVISVGSRMLNGFVRTVAAELVVLEPHPDSGLADLRASRTALAAWPAFAEFCDRFDLGAMDAADRAHVPYFVLLVKAYKPGMTLHKLKARVAELAHSFNSANDENFEEAGRNARLALRADVPSGVRSLITFRQSHKLADRSPFWLLVGALDAFIADFGVLPVSGEVPDMHASTKWFVELKRLYADRFQLDVSRLTERLPADASIPEPYIRTFCRNARFVKYIYRDKLPTTSSVETLCARPGPDVYAVSALIGGVAAQEATKLLMQQHTPALGILKYDAQQGSLAAGPSEYRVIDAYAEP